MAGSLEPWQPWLQGNSGSTSENVMEKRPQSTVDPGREIDLPKWVSKQSLDFAKPPQLVASGLSAEPGVRDLRLKQRLIQAQLFNHVQ